MPDYLASKRILAIAQDTLQYRSRKGCTVAPDSRPRPRTLRAAKVVSHFLESYDAKEERIGQQVVSRFLENYSAEKSASPSRAQMEALFRKINGKRSRAFCRAWIAFPIASFTPDIVLEAITIHQRFQLSLWDVFIIAAARPRLYCRLFRGFQR